MEGLNGMDDPMSKDVSGGQRLVQSLETRARQRDRERNVFAWSVAVQRQALMRSEDMRSEVSVQPAKGPKNGDENKGIRWVDKSREEHYTDLT